MMERVTPPGEKVTVAEPEPGSPQVRVNVALRDAPLGMLPPPPPLSGDPADADHRTVPPDALTGIVQVSPGPRTLQRGLPTTSVPFLGLVRVGVGVGVGERRVRVGVGVALVGVGVGVSLSVGVGDSDGSSLSVGMPESGGDTTGPLGAPCALCLLSGESDMT